MVYLSGALCAVIFVLYMVFKAHHDTIDYRTIIDDQLPENFIDLTVYFISDVHRRKIKYKTIHKIKDKIDFIAIGGDLTEKGVPLARSRENVRRLKSVGVPVYYVYGNHEEQIDKVAFEQMLREEGVIILADENQFIHRGDQVINLLGFDYHLEKETRLEIDWMSVSNYFTILLVHVPNDFLKINPIYQRSVNVVLAGHTHGGQIRVFGFGYYEKGGLTQHQQTQMLISEGYGYTMLPFRLQTEAQSHVLTFKKRAD